MDMGDSARIESTPFENNGEIANIKIVPEIKMGSEIFSCEDMAINKKWEEIAEC